MRAHRYRQSLTFVAGFAGVIFLGTHQSLTQAVQPVATVTNEARSPEQSAAFSGLSPETQGDLLMARGSYAAALGAYQRSSLESAVVWNKMGIAYHHLFALEEARKHYQRALALNPHYSEALNNLAAVYHGEHNYKQAEKTYKQALKFSPNSAITYKNLGTAYLSDQKYKQGTQAYHQAFILNPNIFDTNQSQLINDVSTPAQRASVNYYLAKTYATAGNKEQALAFLRKALDAGFSDRKRLIEDPDFAQLRDTPEFQQLMEQLHLARPSHRAAG
jgi:tetratricopeptide (TPR) repeat protein